MFNVEGTKDCKKNVKKSLFGFFLTISRGRSDIECRFEVIFLVSQILNSLVTFLPLRSIRGLGKKQQTHLIQSRDGEIRLALQYREYDDYSTSEEFVDKNSVKKVKKEAPKQLPSHE